MLPRKNDTDRILVGGIRRESVAADREVARDLNKCRVGREAAGMNDQSLTNAAGNRTARLTQALMAGLFVVPIVMIVGKSSVSPVHDFFWRWCSLTCVPVHLAKRVQYVLVVPLGAALVVFCRLSLGIRILGPFRSVLMGESLRITGIGPGLGFLVAVTGLLLFMRPVLKVLRLPYFGRITFLLGTISVFMIFTFLLASSLGIKSLQRVAYFPIVVICLITEGFAITLAKEGWFSAVWRAGMTVLVAVLITVVISQPVFLRLVRGYPELLMVQVGLILAISRYGDWRLLERFNPEPQTSAKPKLSHVISKPRPGENPATAP